MNTCIDIEKGIELVNKKSTSVDQLCKFIYRDIQAYQDSREEFYLQQVKDQHSKNSFDQEEMDETTQGWAISILDKIIKDTQTFSVNYSIESIDVVLDAVNQNRFKTTKGSESLLVLLSTLKEINEKV